MWVGTLPWKRIQNDNSDRKPWCLFTMSCEQNLDGFNLGSLHYRFEGRYKSTINLDITATTGFFTMHHAHMDLSQHGNGGYPFESPFEWENHGQSCFLLVYHVFLWDKNTPHSVLISPLVSVVSPKEMPGKASTSASFNWDYPPVIGL